MREWLRGGVREDERSSVRATVCVSVRGEGKRHAGGVGLGKPSTAKSATRSRESKAGAGNKRRQRPRCPLGPRVEQTRVGATPESRGWQGAHIGLAIVVAPQSDDEVMATHHGRVAPAAARGALG